MRYSEVAENIQAIGPHIKEDFVYDFLLAYGTANAHFTYDEKTPF